MRTVTLLSARRIDRRRLERRLAATGQGSVLDTVGLTDTDPEALASEISVRATRLLGVRPRAAVFCAGDRDATVAVARAVAADTPILVYDDGDTAYLVHPRDGLIGPDVYRKHPRDTSAMAILRRMLGVTPD